MKAFPFMAFFGVICSLLLQSATTEFAWSEDKTTPIPKQEPPPASGFLQFKSNDQKKLETLNTSNRQSEGFFRIDDSYKNLQMGQSRAQEMIVMLKNQDLTDAFKKITLKNNRDITGNPAIAAPLFMISGAAAFWYGKTMKLFQTESMQFNARIEGQSKRSEFSMSSPLLNGKLNFNDQTGMNFGVGRQISSINANAYLNYNFKEQSINTEIRQKLSPQIDLTFGVGKTDQKTKIEYRINF